MQCALLYTTTDGARRVRISTLALPVSDQMGAVFKGADLDAQLAGLTRQVCASLPGAATSSAKEQILARVTATLAAYRKHCATSSSTVRDRATLTMLALAGWQQQQQCQDAPTCALRTVHYFTTDIALALEH